MAQHALDARRRLRDPPPVRHRHDRAEAARERAAERRVVRRRPPPEVVRLDVALHGHAVVRQVGEIVERRERLHRVVDDLLAGLPRQAADRVQDPAAAQDVDELRQRALALRANDEVDVRRAQHGARVLRREVAAPDDRHVRQRRLHAAADLDRLRELRPRHHGDGEQRRERSRHGQQPRDDLGERQQRERQRTLAGRRRARVEEHDHRATHNPNAAGARRRRTRARLRRRRHPSDPREGTNSGRSWSRSAIVASVANVR